jgi:predicted DNA-binding protein
MIRTQIQLTEKQYKTLKELSARDNASMAGVIREAVECYCAERTVSGNKEKYRKAMDAVGKFESDYKDISKNHDKYLAEDYKK